MKEIKKLVLFFANILIILSVAAIIFADESEIEKVTAANQNNLCSGVQRNILIELFVNKDCTVCPKAAFCLEDLAWSYEPGTVILVEAHIWGDGHDIPQANTR